MQTNLKSLLSPVRLIAGWNSQSLARQFLLIGGLVAACAMLVVGAVVTSLIEDAVTRNSAASTALYVDSVIAPLLPDMQTTKMLDDTVTRALDETLGEGALGSRLMSFRLWRSDGTVLYSNDKNLMGKQFPLSDDLKAAFSGTMMAQFNQLDGVESVAERDSGKPLLEIYNPVLQPWSGDVVAVSEFHEVAYDFQRSLNQARFRSWLAVGVFTLAFFLILSMIVLRGSRTIESQRGALNARIGELSALLQQNEILRTRVQRASQRAAALNESYLRRIGADLHDGPAQLVAYASLRLDSEALANPAAPVRERELSLAAIKSSLDDAMAEIRSICSGLVLPQIEAANLPELLQRAVRAHEQRTGTVVGLSLSDIAQELSTSAKICIYRFVQEALNNGYRHGDGAAQKVDQGTDGKHVTIAVSDDGPGFDPARIPESSLGLAGLRERVESVGGVFELSSSKDGTIVRMSLSAMEMEQT
ncbi:sensor histidine kinase [Agrobacterium rhizogenes]|uniref:sensor histidine kinase n=1 Tax=Rhizobium rhizogenes TaxID=359 RepID=UPI0004D6278C|nr:sensor histidine kinase [Rhizobium rhizogenes]OCJ15421.1 histidine kinase [Agrobacterium sp. B133/95]KEA09051.1 histidine kinase [Rhizobium rhizogenes]MQB30964.1 sensor histidine kinase [Rhizobium rhizogenes]NTF71733.1 sensor histidine kinase [Rhizobium rhizogenes]NTF84725.1 sensor histidine kinase [Rhizobium rhizogenes]